MERDLDLSLYLVTNRGEFEENEFFKIIMEAVAGGVSLVQLREKKVSKEEWIRLGKKLKALLKPHGIPLIINDNVDVACEIQADGVHLGQEDVCPKEARKRLGKEAVIGLSVETPEQAMAADELEIDYLAASPIFFTPTKPECRRAWELEGLKQLCALTRHPVVAIGGIHASNVDEIVACGAAGVAVVSAIFSAPCPRSAALQLKRRGAKGLS